MSGNARFHDKLHRANHHTLSTGGLLDSAYDPIASPEHPFRGDFILSGSLSASGDVIANNLKIASEITVNGNTTTQNQKIVGSLQLTKQYYGGTAIYAINPTSKPVDRTLSINYENGVYISHDLHIGSDLYGRNAYLTDLSATGVLYGNLPTGGSVTPTTEDISNAYLTLSANSGYWESTYNTVTSNSANWNAVTTYVKFKSYSETSVSTAIPGTFIYTVDLSQGTVFPITLTQNITSFQLQNIPTGVNSFLMLLTQDGTGGKTVTWTFTGKTIRWSGGIPTITSTANATDIYSFMSVDGDTWYGSVAGKNFV